MRGIFNIGEVIMRKDPSFVSDLKELELELEFSTDGPPPNITPAQMRYDVYGTSDSNPAYRIIPVATGNVEGIREIKLGSNVEPIRILKKYRVCFGYRGRRLEIDFGASIMADRYPKEIFG